MNACNREIIDMAGRRVTVPDVIKTAYAPSPYGFTMLYSVAPEKLSGLMFPLKDDDKKYLLPCVHDLPVIGRLGNTEALVNANPDVIIVWAEKKTPCHGPLAAPYNTSHRNIYRSPTCGNSLYHSPGTNSSKNGMTSVRREGEMGFLLEIF